MCYQLNLSAIWGNQQSSIIVIRRVDMLDFNPIKLRYLGNYQRSLDSGTSITIYGFAHIDEDDKTICTFSLSDNNDHFQQNNVRAGAIFLASGLKLTPAFNKDGTPLFAKTGTRVAEAWITKELILLMSNNGPECNEQLIYYEKTTERSNKNSGEQESKTNIIEHEFRQLVDEMRPLKLTSSAQVSQHIMKYRLGYKYQNISGYLKMNLRGKSWVFKGGIKPEVYARLCRELGLTDNLSKATPEEFIPFRKVFQK